MAKKMDSKLDAKDSFSVHLYKNESMGSNTKTVFAAFTLVYFDFFGGLDFFRYFVLTVLLKCKFSLSFSFTCLHIGPIPPIFPSPL